MFQLTQEEKGEVVANRDHYQIYAYLRSQEGNGDPLVSHASGLLLHPSIDEMVDETVVIQGHAIRFATVDLGAMACEIRKQLLRVVEFPDESHSSEFILYNSKN